MERRSKTMSISQTSNSNYSNTNMAKQRKDLYLSNLVEWMSNDAKLNDIFMNVEPEMEKDSQILQYLLDSGKYHLDRAEKEIRAASNEARTTSYKSKYLSQKHQSKGQLNLDLNDTEEATKDFSKAIVYQPLNSESDYQTLANIYMTRARCFLQLDDEEAAAIDFEFAQNAAGNQYVWSTMNNLEKDIYGKFKNRLSKLFNDHMAGEQQHQQQPQRNFQINENDFEIVWDSIKTTKPCTIVCRNDNVGENISVLFERPIVKFNTRTFDNCNYCDRYIRNFLYWPCQFCSLVVYCSKQCYEKEFEYHRFECGLTRYASQLPIMILMLRFYFRTQSSPISPYSSEMDYIREFLQSIIERKNYESKCLLLNVFRQTMDKHSKRLEFSRNKRYYYAGLIMAIEFTYLYDVFMQNGIQCKYKRLNNPKLTMKWETFQWLTDIDKSISTPNDLIVRIFIDLKRFMTSPFTKFEMEPVDFRENFRKERRLLLLTGIFFPQQHICLTNLEPILNDENGMVEIRTNRSIKKDQELLLHKEMRIINNTTTIDTN
ncbi:down and out [Dermatophagoides pteronyssinus]|uniref:down and out n=1 Tax=Dermatophagoides pteronyssinus TaxID=6956 RepID=UPI003F682166